MDGSNLPRAAVISYLYIGLLIPFALTYILPFLMYRRGTILILFLALTLIEGNFLKDLQIRSKQLFLDIPVGITYSKENTIYGAVRLPQITSELVNKLRLAFKKYQVPENGDFLDLTNRGTLYYFLQKAQPTPFLSYYNVGNPEFDRHNWKLLSLKKPDFILLGVNEDKFASLRHDDLPISLRVNKVYQQLMTDNSYSFRDEDDLIFLVNEPGKQPIKWPNLAQYDSKIGIKNIAMLPDAWGSSSQKLSSKMIPIDPNFSLKSGDHSLEITLAPGKSFKDFDLLQLDSPELALETYQLKINSICTTSALSFQSRMPVKLIPLDVMPSWLYCPDFATLSISWQSTKTITKNSIRFFKRR
ncbi:MAG: hypothetical protein H7235_11995 [Bdellovibrionaceae bacterium]|nr:hypothetical protein [Pseudobdellovibrionaceae bacterium]